MASTPTTFDTDCVLMLHLDGSDLSTTITDDSTSAKTMTANGGAVLTTAIQKFGTASLLLVAATSSYLSTPDSTDWAFGTGDWTIDFWVRFNSLPADGSFMIFFNQRVDANNFVYCAIHNTSGTYYLDQVSKLSGAFEILNFELQSAAFSTNTWYHLAFIRTGNNFRIFKDGTQVGSDYTSSNTWDDIASQLVIGRIDQANTFYLDGWVDEYRVVKGTAVWTSAFTPPTAAYIFQKASDLFFLMFG